MKSQSQEEVTVTMLPKTGRDSYILLVWLRNSQLQWGSMYNSIIGILGLWVGCWLCNKTWNTDLIHSIIQDKIWCHLRPGMTDWSIMWLPAGRPSWINPGPSILHEGCRVRDVVVMRKREQYSLRSKTYFQKGFYLLIQNKNKSQIMKILFVF